MVFSLFVFVLMMLVVFFVSDCQPVRPRFIQTGWYEMDPQFCRCMFIVGTSGSGYFDGLREITSGRFRVRGFGGWADLAWDDLALGLNSRARLSHDSNSASDAKPS